MKQKLILGFAVIVVGVLALIILLGRPEADAPEHASARLTSEEILMSDPDKAGGLMYLYDYKAETPVTPAPRGYKPFYVTHYGRHGAR